MWKKMSARVLFYAERTARFLKAFKNLKLIIYFKLCPENLKYPKVFWGRSVYIPESVIALLSINFLQVSPQLGKCDSEIK